MGGLVGRENYVFILKKCCTEQITESVVLFVECEDCSVRLARVGIHCNFGLSIGKEEQLESIWGVHIKIIILRAGIKSFEMAKW